MIFMDNNDIVFFSKKNDAFLLKDQLHFESKITKELLESKEKIFDSLSRDIFIQKNIHYFFTSWNSHHDEKITSIENFDVISRKIKDENKVFLDYAKLILNSCFHYNWDNIWKTFKVEIAKDRSLDVSKCNTLFMWILILIYLEESPELKFEYLFFSRSKSYDNIENWLDFRVNRYKNDYFSTEIILGVDNINSLLEKIKKFFERLDDFLIANFISFLDFINYDYEQIKIKLRAKQYFFESKMSKLFDVSNKNFVIKETTVNKLNLPIFYIFLKYLFEDNCLIVNKNLIEEFINKFVKILKIKNHTLLRENIFEMFNQSEYYKQDKDTYIFDVQEFIFYPEKISFEDIIIENLEGLVSDVENYYKFV